MKEVDFVEEDYEDIERFSKHNFPVSVRC